MPSKSISMVGGGDIIADEIDAFNINVIPILVGTAFRCSRRDTGPSG